MSSIAKKGTILVMDDEPMVCEIAAQMLEYLGYDVETALEGQLAIALYQERYDRNAPFDVVIMDLNMPQGFGGKEAVGEVLKINPKAKVIISSGYANDPVVVGFRDYGFAGCLTKPFDVQALENLLAELPA